MKPPLKKAVLITLCALLLLGYRIYEYHQAHPGYAFYYLNQAQKFENNQNFPSAIKSYNSALLHNPLLTSAHLGLGKLYAVSGNMSEAYYHFLQVVTIGPSFSTTPLNLKTKEISKEPIYSEGCLKVGEYYLQKNEYQDAIPYLERAVIYDESSEMARYQLAMAYIKTNAPQKANEQANTLNRMQLYSSFKKIKEQIPEFIPY